MNYKHNRTIVGLAMSLLAWALSSPLSAMEPSGDWVDVTNNVGGSAWGAYGVHYMAAVPDSSAVIAGVSERGLWASADNGATWAKLGGDEIRNRPDRIVFDPKDSNTFWVSGCYGDSPFRTDDGGHTFHRLGKLQHSDGISVDFTDPARQTLLLGMHEQSQSTQLSTDGGQTWTKIGDRLPADSNHSSDPIVIDAKIFLTNTAGWKPKSSLGIYRSEDGGKTWTKVSDFGPSGAARGIRRRDLLAVPLGRRPRQELRSRQDVAAGLQRHQNKSRRATRPTSRRTGWRYDLRLLGRRNNVDQIRPQIAAEAQRVDLQRKGTSVLRLANGRQHETASSIDRAAEREIRPAWQILGLGKPSVSLSRDSASRTTRCRR